MIIYSSLFSIRPLLVLYSKLGRVSPTHFQVCPPTRFILELVILIVRLFLWSGQKENGIILLSVICIHFPWRENQVVSPSVIPPCLTCWDVVASFMIFPLWAWSPLNDGGIKLISSTRLTHTHSNCRISIIRGWYFEFSNQFGLNLFTPKVWMFKVVVYITLLLKQTRCSQSKQVMATKVENERYHVILMKSL